MQPHVHKCIWGAWNDIPLKGFTIEGAALLPGVGEVNGTLEAAPRKPAPLPVPQEYQLPAK